MTDTTAPDAITQAKPVAYRHTLHMEGGQTRVRVNEWDGIDPDYPNRTGFGIPGRDYSAEYSVTTEPLYLAAHGAGEGLREAFPETIGRLTLGERASDGERLCSHSHPVPAGHPLYWPERLGEYPDDIDPLCLAHAIEQSVYENSWDPEDYENDEPTPPPDAGSTTREGGEGVNCFGIPGTYRGWRIKQGPDDRFYADAPNDAASWEELRDEIDAWANDRSLSAPSAERIAQILEPWAWETQSANATCARDEAREKAEEIVAALATTSSPDASPDSGEAILARRRLAEWVEWHDCPHAGSEEAPPINEDDVRLLLAASPASLSGGAEERARLIDLIRHSAFWHGTPSNEAAATKIADAFFAASPEAPANRQEAGEVERLVAALGKIMPISTHNTPDYAEVAFGGEGHSSQAMTMHPADWIEINAAYESLTSPKDVKGGGR